VLKLGKPRRQHCLHIAYQSHRANNLFLIPAFLFLLFIVQVHCDCDSQPTCHHSRLIFRRIHSPPITYPLMAEQTLNIPQLLAVILVGFVIIRWFFYSSSTSTSNNPRPQDSRNAARRADPRQVDQIAQMFPQVGRREIQWDLQRNGGSPAATTERILSGRPLEVVSNSYERILA